jgi:hypothetical protein
VIQEISVASAQACAEREQLRRDPMDDEDIDIFVEPYR